jgi:hypothetical protein
MRFIQQRSSQATATVDVHHAVMLLAHFCRNTSAEVLWNTPSRSFTELSAPPPMASAVALLLPAAAGAPAAAGQHQRFSAAVCHLALQCSVKSYWTEQLETAVAAATAAVEASAAIPEIQHLKHSGACHCFDSAALLSPTNLHLREDD